MPIDLTNLTPDQELQLACAAAIAAGPDATDQDIADCYEKIVRLSGPGGKFESILYRARSHAERIEKVKHFSGTVVWVDLEPSSDRAIVVFKTDGSYAAKTGGQEMVRTYQLSAQENRDLANQATSLIGHRVLATLEIEFRKDKGQKFRNLIALQDQGEDAEYLSGLDQNGQQTNPAFLLTQALDSSKWHRAGGMPLSEKQLARARGN